MDVRVSDGDKGEIVRVGDIIRDVHLHNGFTIDTKGTE